MSSTRLRLTPGVYLAANPAEERDGGASDEETDDDEVTDHVMFGDDPLPGDIYSMAIASIVRDSRRIAIAMKAEGDYPGIRCMRLFISLLLVYTLIAMQVWLTYETRHLISPMSVHDIRETYSLYEVTMYTDANGIEHTHKNSVGSPRGDEGFKVESNFGKLSTDDKDMICMIPLSKPEFTIVILLIWTFTCMGEIRAICGVVQLIFRTKTVESMADALGFEGIDAEAGEARIEGMTSLTRIFIVVLILIPRLVLTCFLCWLGSRWLLATTGFADLLLNSIALEFILLLRESLYNTIVPMHTKKETEGTLLPCHTRSTAQFGPYFNTFGLALLALAYVLSYFYGWQQVLPSYKWDIRSTCTAYLESRMQL